MKSEVNWKIARGTHFTNGFCSLCMCLVLSLSLFFSLCRVFVIFYALYLLLCVSRYRYRAGCSWIFSMFVRGQYVCVCWERVNSARRLTCPNGKEKRKRPRHCKRFESRQSRVVRSVRKEKKNCAVGKEEKVQRIKLNLKKKWLLKQEYWRYS